MPNSFTNLTLQHVIDFDHFSQLYELIAERPEISEIFEKYVNDDGVIDARALNTFFIEEQGDSGIDVTDVIQCYEESEILKEGMLFNCTYLKLLGFVSSCFVSLAYHIEI